MVFVLQTSMTFDIRPHFRYIVVNVSPKKGQTTPVFMVWKYSMR